MVPLYARHCSLLFNPIKVVRMIVRYSKQSAGCCWKVDYGHSRSCFAFINWIHDKPYCPSVLTQNELTRSVLSPLNIIFQNFLTVTALIIHSSLSQYCMFSIIIKYKLSFNNSFKEPYVINDSKS